MEASFDLERRRYGPGAAAIEPKPSIFVCGLARAGTSLTVRLLAALPGMASPSYRDMPFPLAPNGWFRLSGGAGRRVAAVERAHGDGLSHDLDTPEAIEEVFWRCFEGPRYVAPEGLRPIPPRGSTLARFDAYMRLVTLCRGGERYISKNNNNVLRVAALAEAFPEAIFVHPFRNPAAQAASLLRQHRAALERQRGDGFRRAYMRWTGHHEFGAEARPFLFGSDGLPGGDRDSGGYWLDRWNAAYRHVLDLGLPAERQVFLDFDALRAAPSAVLERVAERVGLAPLSPAGIRPAAEAPPAVPEVAAETYARLRARAVA